MRNAVKFFLVLPLALSSALALAEPVGAIAMYNGTLFAVSKEGASRALGVQAPVQEGDTLHTGEGSYAQVRFKDGTDITLRPQSVFKVEAYRFDPAKPKEDKGVFSLVKGGLRAISAQLGHRGNPDAYQMKAASATIGIRGTDYTLLSCFGECAGLRGAGRPTDGLYASVTEGRIVLSNQAETRELGAGQALRVPAPNLPMVPVPQRPQGMDIVKTAAEPPKPASCRM